MWIGQQRLAGARVAFTTRAGGVSEGPYRSLNLGFLTDDEPARVRENQRRVAAGAGVAEIASARQVHGVEIADWDTAPAGRRPDADGHMTRSGGIGLLVLAADCLPIALAAAGEVAMLHCGWRGLAGGILERAVARFAEPPAAAVGPGIRGCCYEVGDEVLAAFGDLDDVARGRMLDLGAVARGKLTALGVERIEDTGLCTSCRADLFFSHRRDRGVTGRQGGLAWLES